MYQAGKLAQIMKEMDKYRMDIIGMGEARWEGSGMAKERSGHTVIHSRREENQHRKCINHHVRQSSKGIAGMETTGGKDSLWLDLTPSTPSSLSSSATHP